MVSGSVNDETEYKSSTPSIICVWPFHDTTKRLSIVATPVKKSRFPDGKVFLVIRFFPSGQETFIRRYFRTPHTPPSLPPFFPTSPPGALLGKDSYRRV